MSFQDPTDIDDDQSELTTAVSGDTPTLPSDESPTVQALFQAKEDREYDRVYESIPLKHRIKVGPIRFVRYDPYRAKKSKRSAWYWQNGQAEELIRVTKGKSTY